MSAPIRIAMWSGPRNMSTTMMRSFGARADTACVDEPFYAAYLTAAQLVHPMQDEILAAQSSDPQTIAAAMSAGECPAPIQYQKQMTHHFLERFPTDWMREIDHHVFLIRHPARVIASYAKKMETMSLDAMGFPQQSRIADTVSQITGRAPTVIDSDDILSAPEKMMKALCRTLEITWDDAMLHWSPGPKPEDGAWAPHWYDAVNKSTGFGRAPSALPELSEQQSEILENAMPHYQDLWGNRLRH